MGEMISPAVAVPRACSFANGCSFPFPIIAYYYFIKRLLFVTEGIYLFINLFPQQSNIKIHSKYFWYVTARIRK